MGFRDKLVASGWCQGAFLQQSDNELLSRECGLDLPQNSQLLVLTQTCDLVCDSLEAEPNAELLSCTPLATPDPNLMHGRSSRRLHLPIVKAGTELYVEISARNWHRVPRQILLECNLDPETKLSSENSRLLRHWAGSRYTRAAFPDAFVERLQCGPSRKRIERALKGNGRNITTLYLALNPFEELAPDAMYRVAIYGVMRHDVHSDPESRTQATKALDSIAETIRDCDGLELVDYQLLGEQDMSLRDARGLVEWHFDFLSFRARPTGELPATRDP